MARKTAAKPLDNEVSDATVKLKSVNNHLKLRIDDLKTIQPLTDNQRKFFEQYKNSQAMLLHGVAGTGKS